MPRARSIARLTLDHLVVDDADTVAGQNSHDLPAETFRPQMEDIPTSRVHHPKEGALMAADSIS
jgi:hypothetical protein